MTPETDVFALPEVIKMEDCQALDAFLRETMAKNIQLDGDNVKKIGGLAAQLIAAHQGLRVAGETQIVLTNPSADMIDALETLGLSQLLAISGDTE